jgi:hypothetical protein
MNANSTTTKGKRAITAKPLPEVTREVVNDLEKRIEQVKGRVETGELPGIDSVELQMAGFFIIGQSRQK